MPGRMLKIEEVAKMLNVSEDTLNRWVDHDRFPCSFADGRAVFSEDDISEWMRAHRDSARQRLAERSVAVPPPRSGRGLVDLVVRGGIFYQVPGELPAQAIAAAVGMMHLPDSCDRQKLIELMQEREKVISTAIGAGIAVPHARNPVLDDEADERVSIAFLRTPVDFKALDRVPVSVLFIMLSANRRTHLQMLQRIGYFASQDDFLALLRRRAPREEICLYLDAHRQVTD
ncbi:MAG: PTS sugar transporter subunit IIA [Victivallaceae bacterium]|nr:PTS sugar transporter subunit IIA [Victivallaceae bacterium]